MDESLAFVFPGQGSQSIGMMKGLMDSFPNIVQPVFDEASAHLGYNLWQLIQEGPVEKLNLTEYTQPALLAASVAAWRVWNDQVNIKPAWMAGHSLGEYTALVCAGSIDYATGIKLVQKRGRLMQDAVSEGEGAIAVIVGLDLDYIKLICAAQARNGTDVIGLANLNSPEQTVISGQAELVEEAMILAKERGAKLVKKLPISVPAHSHLLQYASDKLSDYLRTVAVKTPEIPVINNVDVEILTVPTEIRYALVRQLYSTVRWVEIVEKMVQMGVKTFVECGPGKVLTGLIKRIDATSIAQGIEEALACHLV